MLLNNFSDESQPGIRENVRWKALGDQSQADAPTPGPEQHGEDERAEGRSSVVRQTPMSVHEPAKQIADGAEELPNDPLRIGGVDVGALRVRGRARFLHVQLRCVFVHEIVGLQVVNELDEVVPVDELEAKLLADSTAFEVN